MKWGRFAGFLLICGVLFSALNPLQGKMGTRGWKTFYQLPPNSLDIIYVGNSHNYSAINPQVIDDILNINSYIIGIPGDTIVVTYYEVKEALKTQSPRAFMVETYVLDLLSDQLTQHGYYYRFLDAAPFSVDKIPLIIELSYPDNLKDIFPALRTRVEWENPSFYLNKLKNLVKKRNKPVVVDETKGQIILTDVISSADYKETIERSFSDFKQTPAENREYLEKTLELLQQHDVIPIFATTPILQVPDLSREIYAPMDKEMLAKRYGLDIINFSQQDFTQLHFFDFNHLNAFGSIIVSTELAAEFSEKLSLPADPQALQYYRTYYFDGFDITQSGSEARLTLYPADPQAPLLYSWKIKKGKTTLIETEYQPDNAVTFSTTEVGTYKIQVQIWNPEGDFVLEGKFTHVVGE